MSTSQNSYLPRVNIFVLTQQVSQNENMNIFEKTCQLQSEKGANILYPCIPLLLFQSNQFLHPLFSDSALASPTLQKTSQ